MSGKHSTREVGKSIRVTWPTLALALFVLMSLALLLPPGDVRALVTAPIFLSVPGALTLGSILGTRRLSDVEFSIIAVLTSVAWSAFASLWLYLIHIKISTESTYLCLLAICAGLAGIAQFRVRHAFMRKHYVSQHEGHVKADGWDVSELPDISRVSGIPVEDARGIGRFRSAGYTLGAFAVGVILLAGGTYSYLHVPRPKPTGYTWIAWTGKPVTGTISVGSAGLKMPFEIVHHDSEDASYRLAASWTGLKKEYSLAKPISLNIGQNKTVDGNLDVPQPPSGCTFRITVTLTEVGKPRPKTWSVNANVRRVGHSRNACVSQ